MGFSWSSAVAQDVMLAQTTAVGLDDRYLLADDKAAPNLAEVDECFAVCTDDVMHWSRSVPLACDRLARLDVQWGKSGITRRPDKDIDWSLTGTVIGCDFDGGHGFLDANADKQLQTMHDAVTMLATGAGSPCAVMQLMGSLQWFDLLVRSKLAVYQHIYDFERLPNPAVSRELPSSVRSELQVSLALAPFWSADLGRPYLPLVSATDASTTYGFGVCVADVDVNTVRNIAGFAEKRGDYVVLDNSANASDTKLPKRRVGLPRHLGLSSDDFATILSVRAKNAAHNNILEAEAYLLWLRWLLRASHRHGVRAVCLVDSKGESRKDALPLVPFFASCDVLPHCNLLETYLSVLFIVPRSATRRTRRAVECGAVQIIARSGTLCEMDG
jgi:hypothetical protein